MLAMVMLLVLFNRISDLSCSAMQEVTDLILTRSVPYSGEVIIKSYSSGESAKQHRYLIQFSYLIRLLVNQFAILLSWCNS